MKKLSLAVLVAAGLVAGAAQASPLDHVYAGAGVGYSDTSIAAPAGTSVSGGNASYEFFTGYRFNKYLGTEFNYTRVGDARVNVGSAELPLRGDLFSLSALGYYPLPHNVSVFGRAGVGEARFNFLGETEVRTVAVLGLGAQYDFNKNYAARAELKYIPGYQGGGSHLVNVGASLVAKF